MKLLIITALLSTTLGLTAQEKLISIISNPVDTTYRIIETTVSNNDTINVKKVTAWQKEAALLESMYLLARQAETTKEQRQTEALRAEKEAGYYISTLDTLLGAGTYIKTVRSETQKILQGNWKLVQVEEGKENKVYTLVVENQKVSGAKEGTLEAQDSKSAKLSVQDLDIVLQVFAENALAGRIDNRTYYMVK